MNTKELYGVYIGKHSWNTRHSLFPVFAISNKEYYSLSLSEQYKIELTSSDLLSKQEAELICLQRNLNVCINISLGYGEIGDYDIIMMKPMSWFVGDFDTEMFQDLLRFYNQDDVYKILGQIFVEQIKETTNSKFLLPSDPKPFTVIINQPKEI